jgi:hypothetical protein
MGDDRKGCALAADHPAILSCCDVL